MNRDCFRFRRFGKMLCGPSGRSRADDGAARIDHPEQRHKSPDYGRFAGSRSSGQDQKWILKERMHCFPLRIVIGDLKPVLQIAEISVHGFFQSRLQFFFRK